MQRVLILALALGLGSLTAGGQAQKPAAARTTLELQQLERALAGQLVQLRLIISHWGKAEVIGGLGKESVPCPLFKVYDKAGGPPLIERYILADCIVGEKVTFKANF